MSRKAFVKTLQSRSEVAAATLEIMKKEQRRFQSIIGSLMYAMIGTRPDIAFVMSELLNYVSKPVKNHLVAAKRV
jgi:hypothetical protein